MASGEALFNPYLPEFHADPYPFYHRLRAVAPVYQTPMGFWVLTRYDDVVTVLRDPRFGRDGFEQMLAAVYADDRAESSRLPRSMLFRDPPDHTRLRALVSKAFTPRVIERMREHIQDIVNRLLGRVRDAKGIDRKSTRLNSSHTVISYAVFCLKKKKKKKLKVILLNTTHKSSP